MLQPQETKHPSKFVGWSMEQFLHQLLLILISLSIVSIDSYQIRSSPCYPRRRFHSSIRASSNIAAADGKVPQIHVSFNYTANIPTVFHEVWRLDRRNQIQHVELWRKTWWTWLVRFLPSWWPSILRPKPDAKVGVRTYVSSSSSMDEVIDKCFTASDSGAVVGILVYMWISPWLRGTQKLGDYLLSTACSILRDRLKAQYMLLVHDDNGSGKLIQYYQQRGFLPIFSYLDKAMIGQLS